jgi:hypothetical protein
MQYLLEGLFPINAPADIVPRWVGKIQPKSWTGLAQKCGTRSLREIAKEYGVSHEAVRRALREATGRVLTKER